MPVIIFKINPGVSGPDPAVALDDETEKWNAGLTFGYEYRIVKHLNVMCRVSAGLNDLMHSGEFRVRMYFLYKPV